MRNLSILLLRVCLVLGLPMATHCALASKVTIVQQDNKATLQVNEVPFFVKGAGMGYTNEAGIRKLASAGDNAFRTWDTAALDTQLAAAHKYGLMVLVGLDIGKELQGFDYRDAAAVSEQQQRILSIVREYQGHSNILGWILGNELNLMVNQQGQVVPADPLVYKVIGELAKEIRRLDHDHPLTMAFAFTSTLKQDIGFALEAIPDLDFISLQAYGALPVLPQTFTALKPGIPFMITEYGPMGHWEMPATRWGREIEEPSGRKAKGMRGRMNGSVINDPTAQLLGSFAFLWGQKQERTPTWYGLFLASGEKTASVDELTQIWTGKWPANRAPAAWSITLQERSADQSVTVDTGDHVKAFAIIEDPEGDNLAVRWELLEEVVKRSHGGHFERAPKQVDIAGGTSTVIGNEYSLAFNAPSLPGQYRLFIYATDAHGGAATANIPFLVVE